MAKFTKYIAPGSVSYFPLKNHQPSGNNHQLLRRNDQPFLKLHQFLRRKHQHFRRKHQLLQKKAPFPMKKAPFPMKKSSFLHRETKRFPRPALVRGPRNNSLSILKNRRLKNLKTIKWLLSISKCDSFKAGAFCIQPSNHISPKYLCTKLIAIEPSPTAEATRFMAPARTSPAAKMPAQLVSNK